MINVEKDDALFILSHEPDKEARGYNLLNRHFIFSRWKLSLHSLSNHPVNRKHYRCGEGEICKR